MAAIGGDIVEIGFSNDDAGSGTLYLKSDETSTFDTGGHTNEVTVDGAGNTVIKKVRKPWMFEGTVSWDMNTREDMEAVQKLADSLTETTFDITHINGTVWGGKGTVDGDIQGDGNEGSIPITLKGGGKLAKQ